jgi:hypothetical protein
VGASRARVRLPVAAAVASRPFLVLGRWASPALFTGDGAGRRINAVHARDPRYRCHVGPDRNKHLRNIAIILVLAAAVWLLPGGGDTSQGIVSLLLVIMWGGLLFFGYRLYMEHRMTIHSLDDRLRVLLYGSLAVIVITLAATSRLWNDAGGLGILAWFGLLGLAAWGITAVWRAYREY